MARLLMQRARYSQYRREPTLSPSILLLLFSCLVYHGAISAEALAFIPPPYTEADVDYSGQMTVDGASQIVTINTANKIGLVEFNGTAGQIVSLGVNSTTLSTNSDIVIYNPDGSALTWSLTLTTGNNFHMTLPATGTYTIMVDPYSTSTGSTTLTLSSEVNAGTIVVDGSSVTATINRVGQRARMTFSGTAGQFVSLGVNSTTLSTSSDILVYNPDGSALTWSLNLNTSVNLHMTLPATGTYSIIIDPDSTSTGSTTLTLSSEVDAGTIVVDGASVTATISRVGQRARMTFSGTAGQFVSLGVNSTTLSSSSDLLVYNPDGSALTWSLNLNTSVNLHMTLPAMGTYSILVDPDSTSSGSTTLTLSSEVDAGTIVVDGSSVTATIGRVGQRARMTFGGTAGQIVSLGVNSTTLSTSSDLLVYNPDGSALMWSLNLNTSVNLHMTLPASGTYSIIIDPDSTSTGSTTLTLSSEVDAGTIVVDGSSVTATIGRVGQRARITFSGTAGQFVSLGVNSTTLSSSSDLLVYNPDGSALTWSLNLNTSVNLHMTLPASGSYSIIIDPDSTSTGSTTLTLSSQINAGSLTVNGGSAPVTIGRVGQRARFTFNAASGDQVTVNITGNTMGSVTVQLAKPDGTQQTASTSSADSFNLATQTLSTTGTFSIIVDPAATNTGSMNVAVTGTTLASKLAVTSVNNGSAPTAGSGFPVIVQAQDAGGTPRNVAANTGVSLSLKTGTGTLGGTLTGTIAAGSNQVTISAVTYTKAESGVAITVSRTSGDALTAGDSTPFTVNPGAAAALAFTTQPGNVAAGSNIPGSPTVTVQDSLGNTVTSSTASITLAIDTNPAGGTLSGTTTKTAASGVATFTDLTLDKVGTGYTLTASATGLTGATSNSFNVSPGAAAKLAFSTQPGNTTAGGSIAGPPTVTVQDTLGNTVTSSSASITIAIGTNPSGGALGGTTSVNASAGIAAFSNLSINQAGTGYTLAASSTGLTGTTSSAFNITGGVGAITGAVTRVSDGTAVSGALVEVIQGAVIVGTTTTTGSGSYSVGGLADGVYSVRASFTGFVPQVRSGVTISSGTSVTVDLSLNVGIAIHSPLAGSAIPINDFSVLVTGQFDTGLGEVGIMVNGDAALQDGSEFAALISLDSTTTSVTATVTNPAGTVLASHTVPVTVQLPTSEPILLFRPSPTIALVSQQVSFTLTSLNQLSQVQLDGNGDGTIDFSGASLQGQSVTFADPGLYYPTVWVTEPNGTVRSATNVIQVLDLDQLNTLLQGKWNGMKTALRSGDTTTAASYIVASKRANYQNIFNNLTVPFAVIDQYITDISFVRQSGLNMEYKMVRTEGANQAAYPVFFVLDDDGVWRIKGF